MDKEKEPRVEVEVGPAPAEMVDKMVRSQLDGDPRQVLGMEPLAGQTMSVVHSWKTVQYGLQAPIAIRGMRDPKVERMIGRAIGERDDGKTFSATVDLPWVMPEYYRWQPRARVRLDTFLVDVCKCEAEENETRICLFHQTIAAGWPAEDYEEIRQYEPNIEQPPLTPPGPVEVLEQMHRDFPWARYDRKRKKWVCMLCRSEADAMDNNSTWRNQFIRKHGGCGFVDPESILPASIEDKVLTELGRRMDGRMELDTARAWLLNQRGTLVIQDQGPESSKGLSARQREKQKALKP